MGSAWSDHVLRGRFESVNPIAGAFAEKSPVVVISARRAE